tara:strand:- start:1024 stop:1866 length:843 start_codon:yes stop_codon:yes gene_type:complete
MKNVIWDDYFSCLKLTGAGVKKFLHGQTTADILNIAQDNYLHACFLSTTAKIKALIEIRINDKGADIISLSGDISELFDEFDRVIFPADQVKIQRDHTIRRLQKISSDQSWKETEIQWLSSQQSLPESFKGLNIITPIEFVKWRYIQGIPMGFGELNLANNPFELGLFDLISFDKGCYLGQETISRLIRGGSFKQKLRYWESEDIIDVDKKLVSESKGISKEIRRVAGTISSSARLEDGTSCGLAMIKSNFLSEDSLFSIDNFSKVNIKVPVGFAEIIKI